MSVEIDLKDLAAAAIHVTGLKVPGTTGNSPVSQKIAAHRDAIEFLRTAARTISEPTDGILSALAALMIEVDSAISAIAAKGDDLELALMVIRDSIEQLNASLGDVGKVASQESNEKAIRDEATARKAAIDAECEKKLAAVATVTKV